MHTFCVIYYLKMSLKCIYFTLFIPSSNKNNSHIIVLLYHYLSIVSTRIVSYIVM